MILLYLVSPGYGERQCVAAWQRYTFQTEAEACWHESGGVASFSADKAVRWMPLAAPPEGFGAPDDAVFSEVEVTRVTGFSVFSI